MFYVTNTTATASLDNTDLVQSGDVLANVTSGRWGTSGKNGGDFTLNAANEKLKGKILANNISKVTLNLGSKANWTGSWQKINPISTLKYRKGRPLITGLPFFTADLLSKTTQHVWHLS